VPEQFHADKANMTDRRTVSRLLCADLVEVCWLDAAGRTKKEVMVLEDVSPTGVCLQSEQAHPKGAELTIQHDGMTLRGIVRYCVYQEIGYFLGVEFAEVGRRSMDTLQPKHLFDPESLLKRPAHRS
jgi:hypothetical protein